METADLTHISNIIVPNWSAPTNIKACVTTRFIPNSDSHSFSDSYPHTSLHSEYDFFNLATHVEDDAYTVYNHRQMLIKELELPSEPVWLRQEHTDKSICLPAKQGINDELLPPVADASWTQQIGVVCVVMTADCVPILLCDSQGKTVCAIHAGWQGLENQIISKTLKSLPAGGYMAWIGPAISQNRFEVGQEVFDKFKNLPAVKNSWMNKDYEQFFKTNPEQTGKYFADLPAIAEMQLEACGVQKVYQSGLCSYDDQRFYSYRKACHQADGKTGRMASLIWIES